MSYTTRPIFSGHEKFQCRHLWLKKGYDFVLSEKSFASDESVVTLGVGKNMVSSIRYWMRAFNLLNSNDELTNFSHYLFSDEGKDPYLEDDASLWLLHYHLVKTNYANTYNLMFNEFRKEKIEFNRASFVKFVTNRINKKISENSIANDFDVFLKLYTTSVGKDKEEIVAGILPDLRLIRSLNRDKQATAYFIEINKKKDLPEEVLLYTLFENEEVGMSVSLDWIESEYNSPGSIFAINRSGLYEKIETLCERYDYLVFKDDAGVRELQFKSKPKNPLEILNNYYVK